LLSGFGLGASATALDGSAAALSGAAAELAAAATGGAVKDVAKTAIGTGAPAAAASIWAARGLMAVPYVAAGAVAAGALWDMHQNVVDNGFEGMSLNDRAKAMRGGLSIRGVYRRAFGYDEMNSPEVTPTMTYGTGVGGGGAAPAQVTGTVTGEGKMDITVNAGSSLIEIARQAQATIQLAGRINSNGPGSLGLSSPDAAAPAPSTGGATGSW